MIEGDRNSVNSKKFPKGFVKFPMIFPVKWVPQLLEIMEGIPQVRHIFSNSFFATVRGSALWQGKA